MSTVRCGDAHDPMPETSSLPIAEDFAELVHDALSRLYDSRYLQKHPLANILVCDSKEGVLQPSQSLRRVLLEAIQATRPAAGTPAQSPDWRRHRLLELRYIEGLSPIEVMGQLSLSKSQYFREQACVMEALSAILWERLQGTLKSNVDLKPAVRVESTMRREDLANAALDQLYAQAKWEILDLARLTDELHSVLVPLAAAKHVSFRLGYSDCLVTLCADRVMLRQSLINLVTYALDLAGVNVLEVSIFEEEDEVGICIVADSVATASPAAAAENRQGVGLRISEQLVAAMGGALRLDAQNPDCWKATLAWPRCAADVLLVVDDTPDFGSLCHRYLTAHNWRVLAVTNGEEARQVIAETRPAVIALDVMMPNEDGWELLMSLKADPNSEDIPVIVCSVLNEPQLALTLGAAGYVTKPVNQEALLRALAPFRRGCASAPTR